MVGARASAGRVFNESDNAVVVIGAAYRRRIFGNASGIGEVIKLNAVPATVIGIAADGFGGLQADASFDIIVPFALMRAAGGGDPSTPFRSKQVVGRLARGVQHQEHIDDANGETKIDAERETPHERPSNAFRVSASIMVLRVRTQRAATR
jgi:putative ABC transport system permease protein